MYSATTASSVAVGDYVEVDGAVSEFFGLTEITVAGASALRTLATPCRGRRCRRPSRSPRRTAQREALRGHARWLPQGDFTVADTYTTNQYGEVVLASGTCR